MGNIRYDALLGQLRIRDDIKTETLATIMDAIAEAGGKINNFIATTNPTVDNDITELYSVGSIWYNSTGTGEAFICVDNTEGAAKWIKTTLTIDELGSMAFENINDYTKTEDLNIPTDINELTDSEGLFSSCLDRSNHTGTQNYTTIEPTIVSGNITASNGGVYVLTASATFTDPTPVEGKGYEIFIRNGTATIGANNYTNAGTTIRRIYHSGSWATYTIDLSDYYDKYEVDGMVGLVGTKEVDQSNIANDKILVYNSTSGRLEYQAKPTGGSSEIRKMFAITGTIGTTGTNVANTIVIDGTYTIQRVNLWYGTAGNGTLTIDVNKNGTTLFSTTKPSITGTNQYSINSGALTTTSLASGDILTLDIDAVPGTPGADLYVEIVYS